MSNASSPSSACVPISAIERDTGLSKDTLRVWERRYGFPQPLRDEAGERSYPPEQLVRLRLISRLLNHGHRPGKVVPLGMPELQQLVQAAVPQPTHSSLLEDELQVCMDLVKRHEMQQLRQRLSQASLHLGLARFVSELVSPLNVLIGEAWVRSEIQVFEEHMYTESVTSVLRFAINSIPQMQGGRRPRVLLTTSSQEPHGLGLLMAETLLTLEGCHCVSLGVQTPVAEIVLAAAADRTDIVGLSFSASLKTHVVLRDLQELRRQLPSSVQIWAGGGNPAIRGVSSAGVTLVPGLDMIKPLLTEWRLSQAAAV
jgi:DNA-binding transcriptional MerR regulator/methylmalonyl-CoA mutase cobalamin-binding subunit